MSGTAHALVLLLTVASVGFIVRLVRRRELRAKYSLLWLSAGAVLIVEAASPALLDRVSDWLGVTYAPSTFFMGAIALLFLVVIHFSWELSRLEERTRILAEEVAILRAEAAQPAGSVPGANLGETATAASSTEATTNAASSPSAGSGGDQWSPDQYASGPDSPTA